MPLAKYSDGCNELCEACTICSLGLRLHASAIKARFPVFLCPSEIPMARVTVEDCVEKIPNRFDLVLLASHRSRNISAGAALTVDRDNDKTPVVSLRELAEGNLKLDELRESLVTNLQRVITDDDMPDEIQEEVVPLLALEYGETKAQEMSEADLLRALQGDRENDSLTSF